MVDPQIKIFDNVLAPKDHRLVWDFLNSPGWAYGAYSQSGGGASRYFYKHFSGYFLDGRESRSASAIEAELAQNAPLLAEFWQVLKRGPLRGSALARCYANGMPAGAEGGIHLDSNIASHLTSIYYPNLEWHPDNAGETLFFNDTRSDLIAAVYPRPNRLVIFPGTIPHVARPISSRCNELRITLMFKTMPEGGVAVSPLSIENTTTESKGP
jgi:SM-20-related protein